MPKKLELDNQSPDFSNFFSKSQKNFNSGPILDPEEQRRHTIKKVFAIIFCLAMIGIAGYMAYRYTEAPKPQGKYEAPAGYQMTYPNNEPPKLQKIK